MDFFKIKGRLRRSDFLLDQIISAAIFLVAISIISMIPDTDGFSFQSLFYKLTSTVFLVHFIKLSVKRLHDIDIGGFTEIGQRLILSHIFLLFMMYFVEGTYGDNYYGSDPKRNQKESQLRINKKLFLVAGILVVWLFAQIIK